MTRSALLDLATSRTSRIPEPVWHQYGNCYREGSALFFPDDKEDARSKTPKAKAVCAASCPVKDICLQYALETESQYGVWGGTTRSERKRILKYIEENDLTPEEWIDEGKYIPPTPRRVR